MKIDALSFYYLFFVSFCVFFSNLFFPVLFINTEYRLSLVLVFCYIVSGRYYKIILLLLFRWLRVDFIIVLIFIISFGAWGGKSTKRQAQSNYLCNIFSYVNCFIRFQYYDIILKIRYLFIYIFWLPVYLLYLYVRILINFH